ncbi:uncharacterized protein BDV14DRAFT_180983 [Aspergillus stella-maris]|uniref:uncharacterized protein n=1 Tax=Aspergillus stella-maris TaxID=1810926 RepID=UPI003CCCC311
MSLDQYHFFRQFLHHGLEAVQQLWHVHYHMLNARQCFCCHFALLYSSCAPEVGSQHPDVHRTTPDGEQFLGIYCMCLGLHYISREDEQAVHGHHHKPAGEGCFWFRCSSPHRLRLPEASEQYLHVPWPMRNAVACCLSCCECPRGHHFPAEHLRPPCGR